MNRKKNRMNIITSGIMEERNVSQMLSPSIFFWVNSTPLESLADMSSLMAASVGGTYVEKFFDLASVGKFLYSPVTRKALPSN
ncbi:hypothetical protein D3C74_477730 [compost metagenome]